MNATFRVDYTMPTQWVVGILNSYVLKLFCGCNNIFGCAHHILLHVTYVRIQKVSMHKVVTNVQLRNVNEAYYEL